MHSHQEPKNSPNSHRSAHPREPQVGAGQANGPALFRFEWTICDTAYYVNLGRFSGGAGRCFDLGEGEGFYLPPRSGECTAREGEDE